MCSSFGVNQRLSSIRTTLNHCVTLEKSLHLSALSVLLPGLSLKAAKEGVKGGRLSRGSVEGSAVGVLIITIATLAGWMPAQSPNVVSSGSLRSKACLEGWGWAISGLKVLSDNPFPVTRVPKAKLKQILVKKME